MSKTRSFLENLVIVAIVLVLVQTFLEDLAVVLSWNVSTRQSLLIAGFFFDLFFTVEFIVRGYDAWRSRRFYHYFWFDRGWIDFLASVPLLLFNSGPALLALLAGGVPIVGVGGMLNVLKVVKAIRIARILRLLRVLKIFRRIKNAESRMAQRHVATISAISVSVFVFVLLLLAVGGTFMPVPSMEVEYHSSLIGAVEYIEENDLAAAGRESQLASFADSTPGILAVEDGSEVRYSRYDQEYYDLHFRSSDYGVLETGDLTVFVDFTPVNQEQAATNLRYFVIIVAMILVFLFLYSPHFAMTVSDPIHVMRRGMSEKNYSLEVKIPAEYRDDDVYHLAREYNRVFLPMKDRENASDDGEGGESALTMGNVQDLFD